MVNMTNFNQDTTRQRMGLLVANTLSQQINTEQKDDRNAVTEKRDINSSKSIAAANRRTLLQ